MSAYGQRHIMVSAYPPPSAPRRVPGDNGEAHGTPAHMIKNCVYTCIYIWTKRHGSFWTYPVALTPENTLHFYQWHKNRWVYKSIDLDDVVSFY